MNNQKSKKYGGFDPHIKKKEQSKNKENGKSAENNDKKMDNVLDYQWKML